MLLQELHVQGFRSLKSVTWKPGRLNVLIGPNGGGKSNLLRALQLVQKSANSEFADTVVEMGGMGALAWDGQARKIALFTAFFSDIATESKRSSRPKPTTYGLSLKRLGQGGGFILQDEKLLVNGSSFSPVDSEEDSGTETLLSQLDKEDGIEVIRFRRQLRSWSIYNDMRVDHEAQLRRTTVTRSEKRVNADGQNLIAVLHTLYENDRSFEEFLDKAMKAAFPDDYDKLSFPPAEHGRTEMRVRRKHRKGTDSPADLSDGTLRFLLLVTILGSTDPAPLIAIDEPEVGLHPRMMPIIAEVAANAAIKSQVIFTTHSPEFLDAFRDEPPTVTVVTSNGSETELKTVGGDELKSWVADYSLGKFAFSGEAEAVL